MAEADDASNPDSELQSSQSPAVYTTASSHYCKAVTTCNSCSKIIPEPRIHLCVDCLMLNVVKGESRISRILSAELYSAEGCVCVHH
jgi:hypothetical protein